MKKSISKIFCFCILVSLFCVFMTGCEKEKEPDDVSNITYPPMVMVDGKLYKDTGFVNSAVNCGTCDGKIKSSVKGSEKPTKNDESNFGKGYGYQTGSEYTINVKIDDDWVIFRDVDYKSEKNDIPYVANFDGVAYFDAEVIDTDEDCILLKISEVPDNFMWISKKYGSVEDLKPVRMNIECPIYPNDKFVSAENFMNKKVRIYFDGKLNNTESEMSNPMECNHVYCIEILNRKNISNLVPEDQNEFEKIIYINNISEDNKEDENLHPVVVMDILETVKDKNFTKVYVRIVKENFSFDGVKFNKESGFSIPFRYDINKNGEIIKKMTPEDGSYYKKSILKMTENNRRLAKKMMDSPTEQDIYQKQMNELKRVALNAGLKESDISFELKKIPGYENDVVYIENDMPKGAVCVIKKKDYDELQNERKEIVAADKSGKHWVYRECILWNEKTGISIQYILDYSE